MPGASSAAWELCRPIRRHYLWEYPEGKPQEVRILMPGEILDLNATASWIWENIDGSLLVSHLIEGMQERYPDALRDWIVRDVLAILLSWHSRKLIYIHWEHLR
jgi:hypothetical protein